MLKRTTVSGIVVRTVCLDPPSQRSALVSPGAFVWTVPADDPLGAQRLPVWGTAIRPPSDILVYTGSVGIRAHAMMEWFDKIPSLWGDVLNLEGVTTCTWSSVEDARTGAAYCRLENLVITTHDGDHDVFEKNLFDLMRASYDYITVFRVPVWREELESGGTLASWFTDAYAAATDDVLSLTPLIPLDPGTQEALTSFMRSHRLDWELPYGTYLERWSPPGTLCFAQGGESPLDVRDDIERFYVNSYALENVSLRETIDNLISKLRTVTRCKETRLHIFTNMVREKSNSRNERCLYTTFSKLSKEDMTDVLNSFVACVGSPCFYVADTLIFTAFVAHHLCTAEKFPFFEHYPVGITEIRQLFLMLHVSSSPASQILFGAWTVSFQKAYYNYDATEAVRLKSMLLAALPGATKKNSSNQIDVLESRLFVALSNKIERVNWSTQNV